MHDNKIPISIVVVTYFRPETFKKTLESITKLNYPKELIEIIAVINHKDYVAANIINEISIKNNLNIKIVKDNRRTVSEARNLGIKNASYDTIIVLDDDIVLHPNTINTVLQHFRDPSVAAVSFPCISEKPSLAEKLHHWRFVGIVANTFTVTAATAFKKPLLLNKIGLYREDMGPPLTLHEDWELGSRIRKRGYKLIIDGLHPQKHIIIQKNEIETKNYRNNKNFIIIFLKGAKAYASAYINKHWWSFIEVLKSSPPTQIFEYISYIVLPIILLLITFYKPIYTILFILATITYIEINSLIHRYYKKLSITERLIYPLLLFAARIFRSYLAIIGYIKNKLILRRINIR